MVKLLTVSFKETQFRIPLHAITTPTTRTRPRSENQTRRPDSLRIVKLKGLKTNQETDLNKEKYFDKYIRENTNTEVEVKARGKIEKRERIEKIKKNIEIGKTTETVEVEIVSPGKIEKDLRNILKIKVEKASLDLKGDRGTEKIPEIELKRETTKEIAQEVAIVEEKDRKEKDQNMSLRLNSSKKPNRLKKLRFRNRLLKCLSKCLSKKQPTLFQEKEERGKDPDLLEITIVEMLAEEMKLNFGIPTVGSLNSTTFPMLALQLLSIPRR